MQDRLAIPEDVLWEMVKACDSTFDGQYYYAVKTTGIFCRLSCKSRLPRRENVLFFQSMEQAIASGFRPCKRCRPDLIGEEYDPKIEPVLALKTILEEEYTNSLNMQLLATRVGMSVFYLNRMFKQKFGCTPRVYLERIRVERAEEFLKQGELSNMDVAFAVGFQSVSSFYAAFRKHAGITPGEVRGK